MQHDLKTHGLCASRYDSSAQRTLGTVVTIQAHMEGFENASHLRRHTPIADTRTVARIRAPLPHLTHSHTLARPAVYTPANAYTVVELARTRTLARTRV